jgi:hypothetical protein
MVSSTGSVITTWAGTLVIDSCSAIAVVKQWFLDLPNICLRSNAELKILLSDRIPVLFPKSVNHHNAEWGRGMYTL